MGSTNSASSKQSNTVSTSVATTDTNENAIKSSKSSGKSRPVIPDGPAGLTTAQWDEFIERLSERIVQSQMLAKSKQRLAAAKTADKDKETAKVNPNPEKATIQEERTPKTTAAEVKNKDTAQSNPKIIEAEVKNKDTAKSNPKIIPVEADQTKDTAKSILEVIAAEDGNKDQHMAASILGLIASEAEQSSKNTPVYSKTVMELYSRRPEDENLPSQNTCVIRIQGHSVEVMSNSDELGSVFLIRQDDWNYVTIKMTESPDSEVKLFENENNLEGTLGGTTFTITPREGTPSNYFRVAKNDEGNLEFTMPH